METYIDHPPSTCLQPQGLFRDKRHPLYISIYYLSGRRSGEGASGTWDARVGGTKTRRERARRLLVELRARRYGLGTGGSDREDKWCCLSFVSEDLCAWEPVAIGPKKKMCQLLPNVSVFSACADRTVLMACSGTGNRWIDIYLFISLKQAPFQPFIQIHTHMRHVISAGRGRPSDIYVSAIFMGHACCQKCLTAVLRYCDTR